VAYNLEEAEAIAAKLNYPVVIRPLYAGGTGGGLAYNVEELRIIASRGIAPVCGTGLNRRAVEGWEELELEITGIQKSDDYGLLYRKRGRYGRHTGDSFCTALCSPLAKPCKNVFRIFPTGRRKDRHYRCTNLQFAHDLRPTCGYYRD